MGSFGVFWPGERGVSGVFRVEERRFKGSCLIHMSKHLGLYDIGILK